jgi:hypothetical protein
MARLLTRKAPGRILLSAPGRGEIVVGRGDNTVTVIGPPAELVLFTYGRAASALVELQGDPAAVERVRSAKMGL